MMTSVRPPEFDALLVAHLDALRRSVRRQTQFWREDIESDAIADILRNWASFDPTKASFYTWMLWRVRGAVSNYRKKASKGWGVEVLSDNHDRGSSQPEQEHVTDLNGALARLSGMRNGDILLRRAMGETLGAIANDRGVSKERIRQLETETRAKLSRVAA